MQALAQFTQKKIDRWLLEMREGLDYLPVSQECLNKAGIGPCQTMDSVEAVTRRSNSSGIHAHSPELLPRQMKSAALPCPVMLWLDPF